MAAVTIARHTKPPAILIFVVLYALSLPIVPAVAEYTGRTPISCKANDPLRTKLFYCALHRNYVTPRLLAELEGFTADLNSAHPTTPVILLDAGFPFFEGFPLLPHLSHDDGEKVDIAFWYQDSDGFKLGYTRSPIGYFAFEALSEADSCPERFPTLRWNLRPLQGLFPQADLDTARLATALDLLSKRPGIAKILIEPELSNKAGITHSKIRFQGCYAARHDDHIHVQL